MAKRKIMLLKQKHSNHHERQTDSDLSDSGGTFAKRFKPDFFSDDTNDHEISDSELSDIDQDVLPFSDDEENEQSSRSTVPLHSTLSLHAKTELPFDNDDDSGTDVMNNNQYDGYQNFMSSFQFFSDEESSESDSSQTPKYMKIKKEKAASDQKKKSKWPKQSKDGFTEDNVQLLTLNDGVRVIGNYLKNLEIVFMDYPASVPIVGYLKVTLIAGKASIQGYALKINKPITVFSQKQTGILSVTSRYCEEEQVYSMQNAVRTKLAGLLNDASADNIKKYVNMNMKYSTSVFILQSCILPPALQLLEVYSHFSVSFERKNESENNVATSQFTAFTENERNILRFGPEYEEIFTTIHKHLLKINRRKPGETMTAGETYSSEEEDDSEKGPDFKKITGFRILVSGPKKCGKSTMLKYITNCFLNKYPEVFYLDTDPGQTEFTPPGAISLVKVTQPVFGPAYSHLRKPIKMIYTGTVTPQTSPSMHMKSVTKMINFFNAHFPNSILLVNTMGWLTGLGDKMYQHIRTVLAPAVVIELDPGLRPLNISVEKRLLTCSVGFERDAATSTKQGDNRPADLRDWTILAYLGQCQEYFKQPHSLNAFRPVCICWDNIAVYNFNKRLTYNRYYEALNCSVVALCHVKESRILASTNPEYPMTLDDEPDNDCLGYGFVRAVDEEQHLLYIVTPLEPHILNQGVNALLSGNILIPRSVILEQNIHNVELDYTDVSKEGKTELRYPIRKRQRGHSSNTRF